LRARGGRDGFHFLGLDVNGPRRPVLFQVLRPAGAGLDFCDCPL